MTTEDPTLFAVPPAPPKLSAGQRLTKRNADLLAKGKHPATLLPLLGSEQTCGDCAHHHHYTYRAGSYHKCDIHRLGESHSTASDVRVGWPACVRFEAHAMTATLPGCAAEPIHIVLSSESHTYECGCGWRTPLVADARTARQAIAAHREGRA